MRKALLNRRLRRLFTACLLREEGLLAGGGEHRLHELYIDFPEVDADATCLSQMGYNSSTSTHRLFSKKIIGEKRRRDKMAKKSMSSCRETQDYAWQYLANTSTFCRSMRKSMQVRPANLLRVMRHRLVLRPSARPDQPVARKLATHASPHVPTRPSRPPAQHHPDISTIYRFSSSVPPMPSSWNHTPSTTSPDPSKSRSRPDIVSGCQVKS